MSDREAMTDLERVEKIAAHMAPHERRFLLEAAAGKREFRVGGHFENPFSRLGENERAFGAGEGILYVGVRSRNFFFQRVILVAVLPLGHLVAAHLRKDQP
jgi:hypothetical protein